jgi:hypothetical protein
MTTTTIISIAASVGGIILLLVVIQLVARAAASSVRESIARRFPADAIVLQDNLVSNFGLTNKGKFQARGSGGLVLTREAIHFLPIAGSELTIPLSAVSEITTAKSHLGKTVGRPLLKVHFDDDSVAFLVNDLATWQERLEKQRA